MGGYRSRKDMNGKPRPSANVKIEKGLADRAHTIASWKKQSLMDYLSDLLRDGIERDSAEVGREMMGDAPARESARPSAKQPARKSPKKPGKSKPGDEPESSGPTVGLSDDNPTVRKLSPEPADALEMREGRPLNGDGHAQEV